MVPKGQNGAIKCSHKGTNKYVYNPSTYMKKVFTGFSTVGSSQQDSFKLYDVQLVRQDLINHFYTRIGERVLRPEYGCRIWEYIMEPFTDYVRGLIETEVKRICAADPRVDLVDYSVFTFEHGIGIEMLLNYKALNTTDQFVLNFENRESTGF